MHDQQHTIPLAWADPHLDGQSESQDRLRLETYDLYDQWQRQGTTILEDWLRMILRQAIKRG